MQDSVTRSDQPLALSQATEVQFPLPKSAASIYYLESAGGLQSLHRFARFDLAPEDIDSAVQALVNFGDIHKKRPKIQRTQLSESQLPAPSEELQPVPWWNPSEVTKGYYCGGQGSFAVQIIVDEEHSRIYVTQSDYIFYLAKRNQCLQTICNHAVKSPGTWRSGIGER